VNREHLKAFFWLRWRLRVNQFKKAGTLNLVLVSIAAGFALMAAVGLFVGGFAAGLWGLPRAPSVVRLYVWDGLVLAFLFAWTIGMLADIQRSDALSIDKFLHLPVSAAGAFVVNYLSSLLSLTLVVFVPAMTGLLLGQVFAHGPQMLLAFPLLAAFLLAVTALTYQFQGWLATLMANPRRRRTIIVFVTGGIILLGQAPNLINVIRPWKGIDEASRHKSDQMSEIANRQTAGTIKPQEYLDRYKAINEEYEATKEESEKQALENAERTTRLLNTVLPPGWFPLGVFGLTEGKYLAALLGTLAFGLVGAASLWRGYKTTVRLYTGEFTAGEAKAPTKPAEPFDPTKVRFVERRLPWVSEEASAVALAGFRALIRAPEAKMALLVPLAMVIAFGILLFAVEGSPPAFARPLMAYGATVFLLTISLQLAGNQFGYDRSGFRAFVLSPAPRREILLGKNLAVAPLIIGMSVFAFLVVGTVYPMRIDHYPAVLAQILSTYLLFSLLANVLSILAPIPIKPGSVQAAQVKIGPVLLQFVFLAVFPVVLVPVLLPYGLQVLVEETTEVRGLPISLVLSVAMLAGVVWLYRRIITWEGDWLMTREQKILETVTTKVE
jgi:ABC-2 type transport system permease protein